MWGDNIKKLPKVGQINQMCSTGMGWVVNPSTSGKRVTLLKVQSSKNNATWITVEGRSLVREVILALDPPKILLRTHGEPVFVEDVIGKEFEVSMILNAIDTVIRLVEAKSLCVGHVAIPEIGNGNGQLL